MDFTGQKILVLGGSGALGARFVNKFLASGASVFATASTRENLTQIPEGSNKFVVDLTLPTSINEFINQISAVTSDLDGIVIATGGVGFGVIEENSAEIYSKITNLNYLGPAQVVSGLSSILKNHTCDKAFVLALTGVVVEQTFPGMSAYTAAKCALSAFIQTLDKEWRKFKIRGFDIHLGHTETGLANRALFGQAPVMPNGLEPDHAIDRIFEKLASDIRIVESSDFN